MDSTNHPNSTHHVRMSCLDMELCSSEPLPFLEIDLPRFVIANRPGTVTGSEIDRRRLRIGVYDHDSLDVAINTGMKIYGELRICLDMGDFNFTRESIKKSRFGDRELREILETLDTNNFIDDYEYTTIRDLIRSSVDFQIVRNTIDEMHRNNGRDRDAVNSLINMICQESALRIISFYETPSSYGVHIRITDRVKEDNVIYGVLKFQYHAPRWEKFFYFEATTNSYCENCYSPPEAFKCPPFKIQHFVKAQRVDKEEIIAKDKGEEKTKQGDIKTRTSNTVKIVNNIKGFLDSSRYVVHGELKPIHNKDCDHKARLIAGHLSGVIDYTYDDLLKFYRTKFDIDHFIGLDKEHMPPWQSMGKWKQHWMSLGHMLNDEALDLYNTKTFRFFDRKFGAGTLSDVQFSILEGEDPDVCFSMAKTIIDQNAPVVVGRNKNNHYMVLVKDFKAKPDENLWWEIESNWGFSGIDIDVHRHNSEEYYKRDQKLSTKVGYFSFPSQEPVPVRRPLPINWPLKEHRKTLNAITKYL
jgi:hypothetical protein